MFGKFINFDIILIFRLFKIICNFIEFVIGWNNLFNSIDISFEVDLVWIKDYCDFVVYNSKMEIMDNEFCIFWDEISEVFL